MCFKNYENFKLNKNYELLASRLRYIQRLLTFVQGDIVRICCITVYGKQLFIMCFNDYKTFQNE